MKKIILALMLIGTIGYAAPRIKNADIVSNAAIAFSKLASLSSGDVLIGSAGNVPTARTISGDATLANSGSLTVLNSAVIGKVLTGFSAGAGTVASTDTILEAFQKVDGNVSAKLTSTLADGKVFIGSGANVATAQTISGDASVANSGALTIANSAVSNAKMADMAQSTIKGRAAGAGTGAPTDLTATEATAILNNFVGDSGSGGTKGLVPAPSAGDAAAGKYMSADGTWSAPSSGSFTAASQAEMEAASSTTVGVTPGREKYHPGVAKAWVFFTGTGTLTVNASYNVSSVTDHGGGDYQPNFTTSFSSVNYAAANMIGDDGGTGFTLGDYNGGSATRAVGSHRFRSANEAGTSADAARVAVVWFGDQ